MRKGFTQLLADVKRFNGNPTDSNLGAIRASYGNVTNQLIMANTDYGARPTTMEQLLALRSL